MLTGVEALQPRKSDDARGGRPPGVTWEGRADTIKALIDAGWGHRIMVGHDTMVRPWLSCLPTALSILLILLLLG